MASANRKLGMPDEASPLVSRELVRGGENVSNRKVNMNIVQPTMNPVGAVPRNIPRCRWFWVRWPFLRQFCAVFCIITLVYPTQLVRADDSVVKWFPPPASSLPAPDSPTFRRVTEVTNTTTRVWNGLSQQTVQVTIEGIRVVFDPSDPGGLFRRFSGRSDIESLTIFAEEVVLRGMLQLPGCAVVMKAKRLITEGDQPGINTTPVTPAAKTGIGEAGAPGQNGGNIDLSGVTTILLPNGQAVVFIANGANGGMPGPGSAGIDGHCVPLVTDQGQPSQNLNPDGVPDGSVVFVDFRQVMSRKGNPEHVRDDGTRDWPTDGTAAQAAGSVGAPGAGGIVVAPVDVTSFSSVAGGTATQPYGFYKGGAAGTPTVATWCHIDWNPFRGEFWWHLDAGPNYTHAGTDASSPAPAATNGPAGVVQVSTNVVPWLTMPVAKLELAFANELFRIGALPQASPVYTNLLAAIDDSLNSTNGVVGADHDQLLIVRKEAQVRSLLLAAGYGYYGLPVNWAPRLSLEVTFAAFSLQARSSIRLLYLDYLVRSGVASLNSKIAAFSEAKEKAAAAYQQAVQSASDASVALSDLKLEADAIVAQEATLTEALKAAEVAILEDAKARAEDQANAAKVPEWQKDLRIAGAALSFVPVTAPLGAAIDFGLQAATTIGSIDSSTPWQAIQQLPDLAKEVGGAFDALQPGSFADGWQKTTTILSQIDPGSYSISSWQDLKDYFSKVQAALKPVTDASKHFQDVTKATGMTVQQLNAQLAPLSASHPALAALSSQLSALVARKQQLASDIATAVSNVQTLEQQCSASLLTIAAFDRQIGESAGQLDPEAVQWLDEMARQAQDNLLWWETSFAQAWQFRLLTPYPRVSSNLQAMVERLAQIVAAGDPLDNHYNELLGLLETPLETAAIQILTIAQTNSGPRTLTITYPLSSNAVAPLNRGESTTINPVLEGYLPTFAEAPRILGVRWTNLVAKAVGQPAVADLYLYLTHSGNSKLTVDGTTYQFWHRDEPPLFDFAARLDARRGLVYDLSPSPSFASLIATVLSDAQHPVSSSDLALFAAMAADDAMTMTMEINTSDGSPLQLQQAELVFELEILPKNPKHALLTLVADQNAEAEVLLSPPDINGRTNLFGSDVRSYQIGTAVTLTVTNTIGSELFDGWFNKYGGLLSRSNSFTVTMNADRTIVPKYHRDPNLGAILGAASSPAGMSVSWVSFPGVTYRVESAPSITGPWSVVSTITATDMRTAIPVPIGVTNQFYRVGF